MENHILLDLSKMVYDYCGLRYSDRLSILKDRVSKRLTELQLSLWEYYGYLRGTPQEWDSLVELLTINETYFYREEGQLNECCSIVLPQLKAKVRNRPLRIWSAACSTGEEPYTLSMLIQETGQFLPGAVEIIATDIDRNVLQKAEKAWYHQGSFSFRRIPNHLMKKYFIESEGGFQVNPATRNMVKFKQLNLLDANKAALIGEVDIIFCRNVLIYFDQETTKRVIKSFYRNLSPGGHLFLGHAESITDMGMGFEKVDSDKTFYYRKELKQNETIRSFSS